MNLDEFIKLTLSQIIKGVDGASLESRGKIAPEIGMGDADPKILRTDATHGHHGVFLVEFDVAVTATDRSNIAGGGGAAIYVLTVKAETSTTAELGSIHRIKFSVPITYQASASTGGSAATP